MLDDLAVLQAEEVCCSGSAVFGRGLQQAVRGDDVAVGDGALDVEAHLGELLHEVRDELNERLEAIGGLRVMLDVVLSTVLFRHLGRFPVVEGHVVVVKHRLLVSFGVTHGSSSACAYPPRA